MERYALPKVDTTPLDALLLDEAGRMKALPATELEAIPQVMLSVWCHMRGRYTVPSLELVAWLKTEIAGRQALEIGAGAGDLGHLLGIRMTDSYVQLESPDVVAYYAAIGCPPTRPAGDVERLEALQAVEKYKPRVVLGAWISQLYRPGDEGPPFIGSSVYGVDELRIRLLVETYIHVGHAKPHKDKRISRFKHHTYRPQPQIVFSRQMDPAGNMVQVWNRSPGFDRSGGADVC